MERKIKVSMPIEIPRLEKYVDVNSAQKMMNDYVDTLTSKINLKDLGQWDILILINYRATSGIGVFKKVRRYPSDEEFEISISISIPDVEQISYGVPSVKEAYYLPLNDKNFYIIEPNYANYANLFQYILESSKQAIDLAFCKGLTCNGKKIKFQK